MRVVEQGPCTPYSSNIPRSLAFADAQAKPFFTTSPEPSTDEGPLVDMISCLSQGRVPARFWLLDGELNSDCDEHKHKMSTLIITGVTSTMRRPVTVLTESHDSNLQCEINNITAFIIL